MKSSKKSPYFVGAFISALLPIVHPMEAAGANLISDAGFESGTAGFKVVTNPNTDWVSRDTDSPLIGNGSLNVGLMGDGHEAYLKKSVTGSGRSLTASALFRPNLQSRAKLQLCAVAVYLNGSAGRECSLSDNGINLFTSMSVTLQLQPGAALKAVYFDLKQVGSGQIDSDLDSASLDLQRDGSPAPAPAPSPVPVPSPVPTVSPTPIPSVSPVPAPASGWWQPTSAAEWQWEIGVPLDVNNAGLMGTGLTAFNGAKSPQTDPIVYDIDGFDNPASTVASLHALGKKVVCYIEVGAAETYRPDYNQFPASALGNVMPGYSSEKYVDIRNPQVISIIKARIAMCASKGFDAIEPDIDESYTSSTGFPLTKADEERFMTELANYAHGLGVAMWGKNPDDTGDSYAQDMIHVFDAVLTEECNQYGTCDALAGYKAVFNAEYSSGTSAFCPLDNARAGWNGVKFPLALTGGRSPCK